MHNLDAQPCGHCLSKIHSKRFDFTQPYCRDCGIPWSRHPRIDVDLLNGSNNSPPLPDCRSTILQAYQALLQHQPAANAVGYDHHCAACGQKAPCPFRYQAQVALATYGHNPFPTPAEVEDALGLPLVG